MSRPCRSVLYIPASKERALEKARALPVDAIIFDLEDAFAPEEKARARSLLAQELTDVDFGARLRILRINGLETPWGAADLLTFAAHPGVDAVLVPSRFEPCGLTQMYGLRYGTLPVVAETGGLADTVINANPAALAAGVATGITFHPTDALAFGNALRRLTQLYAHRAGWAAMVRQAMKQPVGWQQSSAAYAALYESLRA